jgi:hypothetical protein
LEELNEHSPECPFDAGGRERMVQMMLSGQMACPLTRLRRTCPKVFVVGSAEQMTPMVETGSRCPGTVGFRHM